MKGALLFLFFFAGCLADAVAQNGVKVGYNHATIGGDATGVSETAGFHAGFFFMTRKQKTSTMFEVLYSSQGAEASAGLNLTYHYVLVPILVNFHLSEGFFAQIGAQPGVLVGADAGGTDVLDQLNKLDFAACAGFGVDLGEFLINVRYNYGISNTSKQATGHYPNMVFQFSIGYELNFGKEQ